MMELSAITDTQEKKEVSRKCSFSEKRSFSVDIFIRNNFSAKRLAVPGSNWSKQLVIFEKWLLGRSFAQKN